MANDKIIENSELNEVEKFKNILEYFVRHMLVIYENISKNERINETARIIENAPEFDELIIDEGCLSGQGYKNQDSGIQAFMEKIQMYRVRIIHFLVSKMGFISVLAVLLFRWRLVAVA